VIDLQTISEPTYPKFYILRIFLLICYYMFRRNCHPQRAYTNAQNDQYERHACRCFEICENLQIFTSL